MSSAPKYHIYIEYAEAEKSGVRFNLTHEELMRTFAEPFEGGQPFWFMGRLLNPKKVQKAVLFWSYVTADKLKLPNRENLVTAKDRKYLIDNVLKSKVLGAYLCTEKFITQPKETNAPTQPAPAAPSGKRQRILVVSGADNEMKQAVTSAITKLLLVPVVLSEEPSQGRKIVERFREYEDAGFAVVLLSADEVAHSKDEYGKRMYRSRQDVVFQLGYLLGRLGKERVLVLFRERADFVLPLDSEGIKATAFDDRDSWKLALIRELTTCGYSVEGQRILS